MAGCVSGKRMYLSEALAEEALFQAFDARNTRGPTGVYLCEDCRQWHLTSQGPMNLRLKVRLDDGSLRRQHDAEWWERHLRR
jgi:hypothetical protein